MYIRNNLCLLSCSSLALAFSPGQNICLFSSREKSLSCSVQSLHAILKINPEWESLCCLIRTDSTGKVLRYPLMDNRDCDDALCSKLYPDLSSSRAGILLPCHAIRTNGSRETYLGTWRGLSGASISPRSVLVLCSWTPQLVPQGQSLMEAYLWLLLSSGHLDQL